eukprot:5960985-Amphidinium_carterae.1
MLLEPRNSVSGFQKPQERFDLCVLQLSCLESEANAASAVRLLGCCPWQQRPQLWNFQQTAVQPRQTSAEKLKEKMLVSLDPRLHSASALPNQLKGMLGS